MTEKTKKSVLGSIQVGIFILLALLLSQGCGALQVTVDAETTEIVKEIAIEIVADDVGCYVAAKAPDELKEIQPLVEILADGGGDKAILDKIAAKIDLLSQDAISPRMIRHIKRLRRLFVIEIGGPEIPVIMQIAAEAFLEGVEFCAE